MSEHFSIVVDIEDPQLDVFIAFPFALETVVDSVEKAVRTAGLTPFRIDFEPLGTSFSTDLVTRTRGARMVLGICTPEAGTGKPNPNVMYELGLADSLGKTMLAITTDAETLPADIRHKRAFLYDPAELLTGATRAGFETRLATAILRMQNQRLGQALIAQEEKHVWVAHAGDRLILTEGFWRYAKTAISFSHDLRTEGELVRTVYLKKLLLSARAMMNPQAGWDPCAAFLDDWASYSSYHAGRVAPVIAGEKRLCADRYLEELKQDQRWNQQGSLSLVLLDYQTLCEKAKAHAEVFDLVHQDHVGAVYLPVEQRAHFFLKIVSLEESIRNLEHAASALVENLILNVSSMYHPVPLEPIPAHA